MAVQMTTSSAQDFVNFDLGTESRSASSGSSNSSKGSGGSSFEDALVSAAKADRDAARQTAARETPPRKQTSNVDTLRARLAMSGSDKDSAKGSADASADSAEDADAAPVAGMGEIASLLRGMPQVSERIRALAARLRQENPDIGLEELLKQIDALLEQMNLAGKNGRFDPDAILADLTELTEMAESAAALTDGAEEDDEESGEDGEEPLFISGLLGELGELGALEESDQSGESSRPGEAGGLAEQGELAELAKAARDADGGASLAETELPPLPSLAEGADGLAAAESAARDAAADGVDGEIAELLRAGGGEADAADAKTAGKADAAAEQSDTARRLEELFEQYRQERESRQGGEQDASRFARGNASRDRRDAAAASAAKRQGAESANASQPRDARADAARDVPLSPAAGMNFKDTLNDPGASPAAQSASSARAGVTYQLNQLNQTSVFGDGVRTVVEFMRADGAQEARIVVEPPALGSIDVSLRATSAGVEATFRVDNEHLKQMLQQQMDILKSSLQLQGIHVSSLAVDIRDRDDQRGREAAYAMGKKSRHSAETGGVGEDGDEGASLVRLDLEKGLLHWVG